MAWVNIKGIYKRATIWEGLQARNDKTRISSVGALNPIISEQYHYIWNTFYSNFNMYVKINELFTFHYTYIYHIHTLRKAILSTSQKECVWANIGGMEGDTKLEDCVHPGKWWRNSKSSWHAGKLPWSILYLASEVIAHLLRDRYKDTDMYTRNGDIATYWPQAGYHGLNRGPGQRYVHPCLVAGMAAWLTKLPCDACIPSWGM
jgi:hypothetical protein